MKKYIKVILITGIVLCGLGLVLAIAGAMNGGINTAKRAIGNRFANMKLSSIDYSNMTPLDSDTIDVTTVNNLDIELLAGDYIIETWDNPQVGVQCYGDNRSIYYSIENDVLKIVSEKDNLLSFITSADVTLYIPKGKTFSNVDIKLSAGELTVKNISVSNIKIYAEAGDCDVNGLTADIAEFGVGAGDIDAENIFINGGSASSSMGDLSLNGTINGDFNISVSMGDISIETVDGANTYNYNYDLNMGDISIGTREMSGFSEKSSINNNALRTMNIECDMGSVEIE